MSARDHSLGRARRASSTARRAGRRAAHSHVIETTTRLGYGVRGIIYIVMGLLALSVAFGKSATSIDPITAIAAIGRQPGGAFLLWVILIGLVCYALWGLIRAVFDPLHKGDDLPGSLTRAGYLLSAVGYAALAVATYGLINRSTGTSQNGLQVQALIASLLAKPWGATLLGLLGLAVIAVGLYEIYQGFKGSFDQPLDTRHMNHQEAETAAYLGRYGFIARGVVIALIGGLVFLAAYNANTRQPVGVGAALLTLMHQPSSIWLLAIVALGLVAFGVYSIMTSVWFRFK